MLGLLRPLEEHEIVGEVRGLGMWAAVDFTSDPETRAPTALRRGPPDRHPRPRAGPDRRPRTAARSSSRRGSTCAVEEIEEGVTSLETAIGRDG